MLVLTGMNYENKLTLYDEANTSLEKLRVECVIQTKSLSQ